MGVAVPVVRGAVPGGRRRALLALGVAATATAMAVSATIAADGEAAHPAAVAAVRALMVGAPCAVGLLAWYRRPGERFGPLLLLAGAVWFVTTFAESDAPTVYTAGRVAGWLAEILLVALLLSFPTGRLPAPVDRLLVGAAAAVVALAFLPRLVLAERFEVPTPFASCVDDCPANALFALGHEPAFVDGVLRPVGAALVLAVMLAVLVRLWTRLVAASPLARRMGAPVLAVAIGWAALLGAGMSMRYVDPSAGGARVTAWLLALAVPALALAFLAGLVRWRLFAAGALERLAEALQPMPDAVGLRRAVADAFEDPSVEIAFPGAVDGAWVDAQGEPVALPVPGDGRAATAVGDGECDVALLVHDEVLRFQPELLRAGTVIVGAAIGNRRLAAEAGQAMREVRRSRARIAASAERERRRIERDLHDGAQQRLVALRIELELAEDLVRRDPDLGIERLRGLEHEVDEALEELRALAHGVYPPLLADRGLGDALRAAARRTAIPVVVAEHDAVRYPAEVEGAVYFCVLEALQNALKHARGASRIEIVLDGGPGALAFSVRDDGAGFDADGVRGGRGLANMRDRVAALGGTLDVAPARTGGGTVVRGRVPIPAEEEELP